MKIWSYEVLDCEYESGWTTSSLHTTIKGAYKAMRKAKIERFNQQRDSWFRYGRSIFSERGMARPYLPDRERVVTTEVRED